MSTTPYRLDRLRRDGRFVTRFAHQLTVASAVPVGACWNPAHHDPAKGWQITWQDGPTVPLMLYLAGDLGGSIAGIALEDLQWNRSTTLLAFALALITNVRTGSPPLGEHGSVEKLTAALDQLEHPQRGTPEDLELARRLVTRGDHFERGMVSFLQVHGLAGLANQEARI